LTVSDVEIYEIGKLRANGISASIRYEHCAFLVKCSGLLEPADWKMVKYFGDEICVHLQVTKMLKQFPVILRRADKTLQTACNNQHTEQQ
jgi:hypothetical protein